MKTPCATSRTITVSDILTDRRPLRVGIVMDALFERQRDGRPEVANGGIGVYTYNLVKFLRRVAPDNDYFLIRAGAGSLDIFHDPPSHTVTLADHLVSRLALRFDLPYPRLVEKLQLDLLHYPNQFGGWLLPRRIKRVVTLHDITPLLFPQFHPWIRVFAYRLLMRRSLRVADHVIVDSESTRRDLLARGVAGENQVSVIGLGVGEIFRRVERRGDFTRRYDLPERYILTVGVLEPRKNHILALRALQRLHESGERVGLVIVGRAGWRWQDPLQDPAFGAIRSWVRIFRNVPDDDLVEIYNRAEVFVYCSLYEGFGLPVLEAMACGVPVIVSRTSSLPEVAGEAALLVDPNDPQDLAATLQRLLNDPADRTRLGNAGVERAAGFTWNRTAQQTLAVYRRVAAAAF